MSRDQQRKPITTCQDQFPLLEFTCLVSRPDSPFFFFLVFIYGWHLEILQQSLNEPKLHVNSMSQ